MPELPEYYRQQRIATGGGGAVGGGFIPDTALQEAGQVLTQAGLAGLDQFFKAQETDQINTFRAETLTAINEYQQTFDPKGDVTEWESGFDAIIKERTSALSKLSNSRARTSNEDWLAVNRPGWQNKVASQSRIAQMGQFEDRDQVNREALMQRAIESAPEDFDEAMADLEDQIMASSGRYIDDQDFLLRTEDEGKLLWNDVQKDVERDRKRFIQEAEQGVLRQQIDGQVAYIDGLPLQEREAAVRGLKGWEKTDRNEIRDRVERQMDAEMDAVEQSAREKLLGDNPDISAAKDIINENLSNFGTDWHTDALNKIQNAASILASTGVNPYATTTKWDVYDEDEKLAFEGKLDTRAISKHTGPDGYSDTEARRLRAIIKDPTGESDPILKDGLSAVDRLRTVETGLGDASRQAAVDAELRSIENKQLIRKGFTDHPEWTASQKRDHIENVLNPAKQKAANDEVLRWWQRLQLDWNPQTLGGPFGGGFPVGEEAEEAEKKKAKVRRDELQAIWEQLTEEERDTAQQALRQGKTVKEITDFFEANK